MAAHCRYIAAWRAVVSEALFTWAQYTCCAPRQLRDIRSLYNLVGSCHLSI